MNLALRARSLENDALSCVCVLSCSVVPPQHTGQHAALCCAGLAVLCCAGLCCVELC